MPRIVRDDIDRFFDCGIYPATRTIYMGSVDATEKSESGVDAKMAERFIKGIHLLDAQASRGKKPITVIMNNPGGDEYHGQAIYDAIITCKSRVEIRVYGHAMSMGSIILQAGDRRLLAPNARLMVHYGTIKIDAHQKVFKKWSEEMDKVNKWMEDLFLKKIREVKPKFKREELEKMLNFDTFLTSREAVNLGLADGIISIKRHRTTTAPAPTTTTASK